MGKLPALATLLVDLLKGFAAVLFASWIYSLPSVLAATPIGISPENTRPWAMASAALLAVAGHSRSIWLRFTGGKSAATGLGALLAMAWPVGLGVAVIFAFVLTISRIVSLSSISAAIAALVLMVSLHQPNAFVLMALVGAAYVIWRHGANIQRLLAGTEPRIGQS
jgi:glycerol-3-phosphate acyltransferase PlsY